MSVQEGESVWKLRLHRAVCYTIVYYRYSCITIDSYCLCELCFVLSLEGGAPASCGGQCMGEILIQCLIRGIKNQAMYKLG